MTRTVASRRRRGRGVSLIELLVAMAIALVTTLAVTVVLVNGERGKRSNTSVNDVNQTAAYVMYVMDRHVRSAGSGFSQRWFESFGCNLHIAKSGTALLPRASAMPAPFDNAAQSAVLAPVLVQADAADVGSDVRGDVVSVMAGTAGFSGVSQLALINSVQGNSSAGSLTLPNTLGFRDGDIVVLADSGVAQGCMAQQVTGLPSGVGGTTVVLPMSGAYYAATGANIQLGNFGGATYPLPLGNLPNNPPQFFLYGVGTNATLFQQDLFNITGPDAPVPVAEGVVEMRAVYGIDTTTPPDGTLDLWVRPIASTGFDHASLSNGSATARQRIRQIVAVRFAFVLRTTLREKEMQLGRNYDAATGTYTIDLFADLATDGHDVARSRTIGGDERHYRYRSAELTVPLRNVMLAPAS